LGDSEPLVTGLKVPAAAMAIQARPLNVHVLGFDLVHPKKVLEKILAASSSRMPRVSSPLAPSTMDDGN
jgi:hypothetical protein